MFLKGLSSTTSVTVDFGDGTAISYVNISSIDDGVKHIYSKVGLYQVSATATNTLGFDRVLLYLHVSCESEKNSTSTNFECVNIPPEYSISYYLHYFSQVCSTPLLKGWLLCKRVVHR